MKPKPFKYAFTADAFIKALDYYGTELFHLPGKLIVTENALLNHPAVKEKSIFSNVILSTIQEHWFDIESPTICGLTDDQEWQALERLYDKYPDEIYLCVDTLNELAYFNRIYANDELLSIMELRNHFI